jgi:pimeloyl-ACP methyl ester carboxylesterase
VTTSIRTFNGTPLFYNDEGDGEPVVLVHGSWAEHSNWDLIVPGLARSYRVIRYDRRGHGQSEADPTQGTVHDDVADLAALIEGLDLAPANVVGNSFGACISLRLAAERPELIRRLAGHEPPMVGVLFGDPEMQPVVEGLQTGMGAVVELLEAGKDADAAQLFVENVALGPGMWPQLPEPIQATFVRNADALTIDLNALARFDKPVLTSQGDQSPPMFGAVIAKLGSALPQARRHVFAGAGHVPQMTHPDAFVETIAGFLASS